MRSLATTTSAKHSTVARSTRKASRASTASKVSADGRAALARAKVTSKASAGARMAFAARAVAGLVDPVQAELAQPDPEGAEGLRASETSSRASSAAGAE